MKKDGPVDRSCCLEAARKEKEAGKKPGRQVRGTALRPAVCAENTAKCSHVKPVPPPQGLRTRLSRRLDRPAGLGYNI